MSFAALLVLGLLLADPVAAPHALRTLEGTVARVDEAAGEGELPLLSLDLATADGEVRILVAPPAALDGIGFEVRPGDRLRARVFLDPGSQVAYAQKILNQSRDLMVRLRTLRHEPLWDAAGNWQGSPAEVRSADRPAARGERTRRGDRRPAPPPPRPRDGG